MQTTQDITHIFKDATNQTLDVFIGNSSVTTGAGLTGLAYDSSGLTCYYRRGATGTATALSLATQTVAGAHSDGGFVEIDATNAPGMYRLDLSDAIVASGVPFVWVFLQGATNMRQTLVQIHLTGVSNVYEWNGDPVATPTIAGVPEVDQTHRLGSAISGAESSGASLADSVADEPLSGHNTAGTVGAALNTILRIFQ